MANGIEYKTYQTTQNNEIQNITNPTKEGHSFNGWYLDADCENKITDWTEYLNLNSSQNTTVYAGFTVNQYTISFATNGGSEVDEISQNYNTTITEPTTPTKAGYVFDGWFKDVNLTQRFTFNKMPAENLTLYPKYLACFNVNSSGQITGVTTAGRMLKILLFQKVLTV